MPEAQLGDYVLVHVGFAISRIDEEAAHETLAALKEMGELARAGRPAPGHVGRASGRRVGEELMRHVDEYRDPGAVRAVARQIHETAKRPWTLMEVCGGQTHSIVKFGLDQLLPADAHPGARSRLSGVRHAAGDDRPGDGHRLAARRDLLLLRRHAARARLADRPPEVKADGGDVRIVYSPLDAVRLAAENPDAEGRLLRRGLRDHRPRQRHGGEPGGGQGIENFSVLVSHVLVPPAIEALLSQPRT